MLCTTINQLSFPLLGASYNIPSLEHDLDTAMPSKQTPPAPAAQRWPVYYFGSGMSESQRLLSNFMGCSLKLTLADFSEEVLVAFPILRERLAIGPAQFSSTEAAWQALKAKTMAVFKRFEVDGDIGGKMTADSFLPFVPTKSKRGSAIRLAESKHAYWAKRGCVGIISKMAVNVKYAKAMGLGEAELARGREYLPSVLEKNVWLPLLRAKMRQNSHIREELRNNAQSQFVEYSRTAKYSEENGKEGDYWAGSVDSEGRLSGGNRMGQFMQMIAMEEMMDK